MKVRSAHGGYAIEREVQPQDVDARLPEEAELSALRVLLHQPSHGILGEAARTRHATHLVRRPGRTDVGIEPAAGRRDQIDRHGPPLIRVRGPQRTGAIAECRREVGVERP
jgi:hypothetical protein